MSTAPYFRQLHELIHEKHQAQARIQNLEDEAAALRAEVQALLADTNKPVIHVNNPNVGAGMLKNI